MQSTLIEITNCRIKVNYILVDINRQPLIHVDRKFFDKWSKREDFKMATYKVDN